jgi:rhodanese-related sulfurtransferase
MKKLALMLVIAIMTISCQSQNNSKIKVIPVTEFKTEIAKGEVQLIDVRTPEEFSEGAIQNAKNINVNDDFFEAESSKIRQNKTGLCLLQKWYARSQKAAQKMIELGFIQVIDLEGGFLSWK